MVFGLLFMNAAFSWPAPFVADRAVYMEHVNALMLFNGIYYSMVLASYYLPAALLMRRLAPAAPAAAAMGQDAPATSVAERMSPSRLLKAILALLAPAAAGALTQLIEGVGL